MLTVFNLTVDFIYLAGQIILDQDLVGLPDQSTSKLGRANPDIVPSCGERPRDEPCAAAFGSPRRFVLPPTCAGREALLSIKVIFGRTTAGPAPLASALDKKRLRVEPRLRYSGAKSPNSTSRSGALPSAAARSRFELEATGYRLDRIHQLTSCNTQGRSGDDIHATQRALFRNLRSARQTRPMAAGSIA